MNYVMFGIYNSFFQIAILIFLLFANTYLNGFIIPNSFKWENGEIKENLFTLATANIFIMLIESLILMTLIYYFNRWYLFNILKSSNSKKTAKWVASLSMIISFGWIFIITYLNFN